MQCRMANFFLVVGLGLSVIAGCGGPKGPKTVDVSGTVYLDDKPLAGVSINFVGKEFAGFAKAGADGKYQTKAQTGENKMYFTKYKGEGEGGADAGQIAAATGGAGVMEIPSKYGHVDTSGIKYTVPDAGAKDADFKLTSK